MVVVVSVVVVVVRLGSNQASNMLQAQKVENDPCARYNLVFRTIAKAQGCERI
jgi:hypothetical protein